MNTEDLEAYLKALEARNLVELNKAKEWMGTKWLLHPDNQVRRRDENAQVLR